MDDEFIGYIFRFISNMTDCLHTNITGVHDVFKAANFGIDPELENLDDSIVGIIENNDE